MSKKRRPKRRLSAGFIWILLVLACIALFITFFRMPMFPRWWSFVLLAILLLILYLTAKLSASYNTNILVKTLNALLCVMILLAAVLLPVYKNKVTELFSSFQGSGARINLYVMSEEYREKHPDVFESTKVSENLSDYKDATYLTCAAMDGGNENYALTQLKEEFGQVVTTDDKDTVLRAVEALYQNEGDVLILSNSYESMIEEDELYESFRKDVTVISYYVRPSSNNIALSTAKITEEPFVVFFGGNDEEGDLYLEGKTDVDMVLAVNPNTHQIAMVSLPRDSYVYNPALGGYDKLTHLGMQGIENTLNGLGQYLGCDIENYVLLNFRTYRNIIDAIGGVDVYNEYEFVALDDEYFPEGEIHLEGEYALMFVRERYALPDGDFGRNYHQQQVMKAIIEKVTSPAMIVHFDSLLEALKGTFLTNLTSDSLYAFCRKQLEENIQWNIVNYHVLGEIDMNETVTIPGQTLSIVYPYSNHVELVSDVIQKVLNGEEVFQEELPEGEFDEKFYQTFFGYNPYTQNEQPVYEEPEYYYEEPAEEVTNEQPAEEYVEPGIDDTDE
ncbi:MAG: LytR family transcriptional regulator [Erysipelotrichaceae bacterium]|nr:LytR family transcriptional regulator [Erysipelotrichaceae bacterium]